MFMKRLSEREDNGSLESMIWVVLKKVLWGSLDGSVS